MVRVQGFNSVGEEMSSAYVQHDPKDFVADVDGPSETRQEFAEDCDINNIMARYEKTGVISHINQSAPVYLDLTDVPDLARALTILRDAESAFMSLPAKVRAEFENDVQSFVAFAEDPANLEQMREWGLAKPAEPAPEPMPVRVVQESADAKAAQAASGTSASESSPGK